MNRTVAAWVLGVALVAAWAAPRPAAAQSTGTQVTYPDDNVRGGAVGERRPGLWTQTAMGRFAERQDTVLRNRGGAKPPVRETIEWRTELILSFLDEFFATLQSVVTAGLASAGLSTAGG